MDDVNSEKTVFSRVNLEQSCDSRYDNRAFVDCHTQRYWQTMFIKPRRHAHGTAQQFILGLQPIILFVAGPAAVGKINLIGPFSNSFVGK